jgi:hypothetical protein
MKTPPPATIGAMSLSDMLMDAALRVDELPSAEVARLLMKAAIRLRVIQQAGAKLEHVPVYAYHLLRRIAHDEIGTATLFGQEDEAAMAFLLSREMIEIAGDGKTLIITQAGAELGEIADERD